jgi:hypothetical protein
MKIYNMLVVLIIGILIVSSTGGFLGARETTNTETSFEITNFYLDINEPTFSYQDEFITIELTESDGFMSHSGEPMLPVITKTFDFPLGTKINSVNVDINWERLELDRKVTPTPVIIPMSVDVDPAYIEEKRINEDIYSSAEIYPTEPYTIRYGAGLKDMEHVLFINVKCFPQYSPANNYVNIPKEIDISIEHDIADTSESFAEQYDLIIVTHDEFQDEFQALVDHKISKGVTTKMVTVDEIYEEYNGAGDWEEIKMYLADHVIEWDTKFLLLGGGHLGQTHEWYVPDFRSNNFDINDDPYEPHYDITYSSDLYFADVYYVDQFGRYEMDTWDSNSNGIFAEGPASLTGIDIMDFYPDVHTGRIPARTEWEVEVAVNKIIDYENNAKDSWFKKAVLAGGDGFPPERYGGIADPDAWEGEIVCDVFAEHLANRGVVSTKVYCSDQGDVVATESRDVYTEISKGCGFAHLTGHANPFSLGSYTPYIGISPPPLVPFYTGFNLIQYDNDGKLPFMVCEGCHNAQFDVTGQRYINQIFNENPDSDFVFTRYEWIPHDASSWLLLQPGGGCIGIIGNTGLGLGGLNYGCTEFVGGWIMLRFAEAWGVDGEDYTGSVWTVGMNDYIDTFDVNYDAGDRKTLDERALLGDPSVKLGGYGSFSGSDEPEETEVNYDPVYASVPSWNVGDSWTYRLDNIDIDLPPTLGRGLTLKMSTGDIKLEVIDETSNSYIASLATNDMDLTLSGMFDSKEGTEEIVIPEISLDKIQLTGQVHFDKESLGWKEINLDLTLDLIENLDNLKEMIGIELPSFLDILLPYMSIPAVLEVDIEFENPFEVMQFPLETNKIWGFPANTITVSIDGSVESIWLRILNFLNRFINIIPAEFAKYLPNIDISEILNDLGIETSYAIDIEMPANLLPYHYDNTSLFEVIGTENINTPAGSFNAAFMAIADLNGRMYYAENAGYIVKISGFLSEYIPIISDLNLELISKS